MRRWGWGSAAVVVLASAGALVALKRAEKQPSAPDPMIAAPNPPAPTSGSSPGDAPIPSSQVKRSPILETMQVAKAVMVTVDLDFGPGLSSIAEALDQIERRYVPDDGIGRTFAILDAYGEPTPDRKLHLSMHVSGEKPGFASLAFRPTGEILWNCRIVAGSQSPLPTKNLGILLDSGSGRSWLVDGSKNPASILDAWIPELGKPVRNVWPDGAEREVTFIYSACGCPVKVMVRRAAERTARTKPLPVIFPDDPPAVAAITRLMKW